MKNLFSAFGLTLALGFGILTGCQSAEDCNPGSQYCSCTENGLCLAGLVCDAARMCVVPNAGAGGQSGSGGTVDGTGGTVDGTGGAVDGTGGNTTSCTEGTTQGSCTTGNAMDCHQGQWTPSASCAACARVSPSSICDRIIAFALDSTYTPIPGGVINEYYSANGASATFGLNVGETGYWQLKFPTPISPTSGRLELYVSGGTVQIALEDGTGAGGCPYTLTGTTADQYTLVYDSLAGCWGGFQPMTGTSPSSPAGVLNVKVTPTDAAATLTVGVNGVALGGG